MPVVSRSQNALFRWAAANPKAAQAERGIKPSVAKEFVASTHGQRVRDLPERVQHKAEGGSITGYAPLFKW